MLSTPNRNADSQNPQYQFDELKTFDNPDDYFGFIFQNHSADPKTARIINGQWTDYGSSFRGIIKIRKQGELTW